MVQSAWLSLYDRNPQEFMPNIFEAKDADYQKGRTIYRSKQYAHSVEVKGLPSAVKYLPPGVIVDLSGLLCSNTTVLQLLSETKEKSRESSTDSLAHSKQSNRLPDQAQA
jgi:hypothetical protein